MTLKFKDEAEFKAWQQKAMDANPKKASADNTAAPAAAPTTAPVNEPKVKTKEDIIDKVQEALRTSSIKSVDSHAKELMTKIVKEFKNTSSDVIEQMHKDEKNLLKDVLTEIAKLEGKNGEAFESGIKELVQIGAKLEASAKKKGDVAGENLGQKIQEQAKEKLFEEKGINLRGKEDTAGNRFSKFMLGKNSPAGTKQGFGERVGATFKGIGASIKEGLSPESLFAKGGLARSVFVPHARERELENQQLEKESKKGEMADIAKDAKGIIDGETPDKKEKSKSDKSASGTGDTSKPIEKLIVAIEKLIVAMDKNSDEKTPGKAEKQKDPTALDKVDAERKDVGETADRLKAGVNGEEPKSLQPRNAKGRFAKKDPVAVNVVKTPGPSTSDKQNMDEARQAEEIKEKTGDTKGILAAETIDAKDPSSGSMLAGADAAAEESGAPGAGAPGAGAPGAGALGLGATAIAIAARALLNKRPPSGPLRDRYGRFIKKPQGRIASLLSKVKGVAYKVFGKLGGKGLGKIASKGLLKFALKKIPGIALIAGLGFGAGRALKGDFVGAGMEVASGAASTFFPVAGTAASVALDATLAASDAAEDANAAENESADAIEQTNESAGAIEQTTVAGEPVIAGQPLSANQVAATKMAMSMGNTPSSKVMEAYDLTMATKPVTGVNESAGAIEQTTKAAAPPPLVIPAAPASAPPMTHSQQKGGIPPMIMERQGVRMNDNSWQRFQDRRAIG